MKKNILPVFGGYSFFIAELDGGGTQTQYYGYQLSKDSYQEGTGPFESVELATRSALARIETLLFDAKH